MEPIALNAFATTDAALVVDLIQQFVARPLTAEEQGDAMASLDDLLAGGKTTGAEVVGAWRQIPSLGSLANELAGVMLPGPYAEIFERPEGAR